MRTAYVLILGAVFGVIAGFMACRIIYQRNEKKGKKKALESVTRILFIDAYRAAIVWVTLSYLIAVYAMLFMDQVYTLTELSDPAIKALLSTVGLKVIGNIFEHNNGNIFGKSDHSEEVEE